MQETDIAVVGGGPAGLVAATVAAEAGAHVTLLEATDALGGNLGLQAQRLQGPDGLYRGMPGYEYAGHLSDAAGAAGATIVTEAPVWGLYPPLDLIYTRGRASERLTAKRLIVATGSTDGVTAFPGWTLPGVMLLGALQRMVNRHHVLPGNRFLILGGDNAGFFAARDLLSARADVQGIVEPAVELPARSANVDTARQVGVPLYPGHAIVRAEGAEQVEAAVIARLGTDGGLVPGSERRIDCDAICLATQRQPLWDLAALAGCRVVHAQVFGGFVPVRDRDMRTRRRDVLIAGDSAGVESGAVAIMQGRLAGLAAAADLGHGHPRKDELRDAAHSTIRATRQGDLGNARQEATDLVTGAGAAVPRADS